MSERPILFSAPMVRAILDGRKTQTRRIVKPQPSEYQVETVAPQRLRGEPPKHAAPYFDAYNGGPHWCWWDEYDRHGRDWIKCPYGVPGDRLWVREAFAFPNDQVAIYRANWRQDAEARGCDNIPTDDSAIRWRPSIHMPRSVSRITLEITGVRVERLNDISEADAKAEGVAEYPCEGPHRGPGATYWSADGVEPFGPIKRSTPVAAFKALWEEINGDESWATNPWVWVVESERVQP